MTFGDPHQTLVWKREWSRRLDGPINCLSVCNPFGKHIQQENDVLAGSDHGHVLSVNRNKKASLLCETKRGAVQDILLHDEDIDGVPCILVGDADGMVTFFARQQIVDQRLLGKSICKLVRHQSITGDYELVAGDITGTLTGFSLANDLWRTSMEQWRSQDSHTEQHDLVDISALHSAILRDEHHRPIAMLFAADGRGMVYILSQGSSLDQMAVIGVLPTPTNILSICSGFFLSAHDMGRMMDTPIAKEARPSPSATDPPCQVLLAGKNGQVYVLADFNIYPWFKTDFDIASIVRFRPSTLSPDQPDLVICAGKSSTVAVYHKGELVSEIHAQDWPRCMTIGDLDEVGKDMLVLGHHDHTIEVFSYDIANSPDMQT